MKDSMSEPLAESLAYCIGAVDAKAGGIPENAYLSPDLEPYTSPEDEYYTEPE